MDFFSILIIAIGLSADSFAVSLANGFGRSNLNHKNILLTAFCFAIFQAFMPLAGWQLGIKFSENIKAADHWIAFSLLTFIGLKMIYESIKHKEKDTEIQSINIFTILAQSIATSIDALIVSISFAFIKVNIYETVLIIGIVTFLFSVTGSYIGKNYGKKILKHTEIIGGIILILIGTKILIEHLYFQK